MPSVVASTPTTTGETSILGATSVSTNFQKKSKREYWFAIGVLQHLGHAAISAAASNIVEIDTLTIVATVTNSCNRSGIALGDETRP
jgi:hypothetical protein